MIKKEEQEYYIAGITYFWKYKTTKIFLKKLISLMPSLQY